MKTLKLAPVTMNSPVMLSCAALLPLLAACTQMSEPASDAVAQMTLSSRAIAQIRHEGYAFRDLDRDGVLDPYEDWRLHPAERVRDLLPRLSLEEKAGLMMHGSAPGGGPEASGATGYDFGALEKMVREQHVLTFITRLSIAPERLAEENNRLQALAEQGRWGIPVTVSSDPRNHFSSLEGASVAAGGFSRWPGPLGLASIGDRQTMYSFADTVRKEYRAVGIHMALSPQADLATEPRWPRNDGTYGEDPELAAAMVGEYVRGIQGETISRESVAAVVKHWIGYPASPNGWDGHNYYGQDSVLTAAELSTHLRPFEAAFAAGAAGVMPTYSVLRHLRLDGKLLEAVGGGYSRELLTDLLRGQLGYRGLILSDWAITNDCDQSCRTGEPPQQPRSIATSWGVEALSKVERFAKGVNAGLDQFGGTTETQSLVDAVRADLVAPDRVDASAARILEQKFALGLFDAPFVEPASAALTVGAASASSAAFDAQRRSLVLLKNAEDILPLRTAGQRVFLHGFDEQTVADHGLVAVDDPAAATIALIRVATPHETLHPGYFFGSRHHEGRLDFRAGQPEHDLIRRVSSRVPTVVVVHLDRPAVLTAIRGSATAIVGEFGASDVAVLDVLTGKSAPVGRLPFALPRSMADVEAQSPAMPHDIADPLYPFGHGLTYAGQAFTR